MRCMPKTTGAVRMLSPMPRLLAPSGVREQGMGDRIKSGYVLGRTKTLTKRGDAMASEKTKIEKKHAAIWKRQQARKTAMTKFTVPPEELIRDLGFMARELDALPDDNEYDLQDLDHLESMLHASRNLTLTIEACFAELDGG